MLLHWNFCCWPLPFCWASGSKPLRMAKSIILGQEYCIASICLCICLLFSKWLTFPFSWGKNNLSIPSPHFPASLSIQEHDKVEFLNFKRVQSKSNQPPSKQKKLSCRRGSSRLKCIPKQCHKCMQQTKCHRLLIEGHLKNILPFRPSPNPAARSPHLESSSS